MYMPVTGDKTSPKNKRQTNVNLYSTTDYFAYHAKYFKKQLASEISGSFVIEMPVEKKLSTCGSGIIRWPVHAVYRRP